MFSPTPPGVHDQTFVLKRLVELGGYTDVPSEAWLLGIGGGVGFQSFTFEYRDTPPILYVGTRCAHQYAYDASFLERASAGAGFDVHLEERGGRKKAAAALLEALEHGPVVVWVGLESLHGVRAPMGETPWVVLVKSLDGDHFVVEDVYLGEMRVEQSTLSDARKSLKKAKHRMLSISKGPDSEPRGVVRSAVARCVAELDGEHAVGGARKSFGLAALERWSRRADSSSKKGWHRRFSPGFPLLSGLRQAYGWIERATGGGAFRPLYASFLREAGRVTGDARYAEAASVFDENGACWTALSIRTMDPTVPLLAECKAQLDAAPWPETQSNGRQWRARAAELPDSWAVDFYSDLAQRLADLHARETHARNLLAAIVH